MSDRERQLKAHRQALVFVTAANGNVAQACQLHATTRDSWAFWYKLLYNVIGLGLAILGFYYYGWIGCIAGLIATGVAFEPLISTQREYENVQTELLGMLPAH